MYLIDVFTVLLNIDFVFKITAKENIVRYNMEYSICDGS